VKREREAARSRSQRAMPWQRKQDWAVQSRETKLGARRKKKMSTHNGAEDRRPGFRVPESRWKLLEGARVVVELWREGRLDASRKSGPAPYANPSTVGRAVSWPALKKRKAVIYSRKAFKLHANGNSRVDSGVFFSIHCSLRDLSLLGHPHPAGITSPP
jgi:hypothetical protein